MRRTRSIKVLVICSMMLLSALFLGACAPAAPAATQDITLIQTQSAQTVVADLTKNAPPPPTDIPTLAQPTPGAGENLPVALLPTPAPGEPIAIARYNSMIYGGPGKDYVVYGAFLGGKAATVIGRSEDGLWWAVSVPVAPSGEGWVDAGAVDVSYADAVAVLPTPPLPPTTKPVPPGPADPQATVLTNTPVRSGPATNFPAYGTAPAGATAWVIGKSEDGQWWAVRLDPKKVGVGHGWLMAQYTSAKNVEDVPTLQSPVASKSSPPPTPAPGAPSGTVLEYVNVRSGPGTNYPVLVVAPPGASSEVTGRSADNKWWQVKISTEYSPSGLGWVAAGYGYGQNLENVPVVEAPPPPPVVQPTPPAGGSTGCKLAGQSPVDGTVFKPGSQFNTTWVLKNISQATWDENEYDIIYVGAVDNIALHTGPDRYDLTITMDPGWTYTFWVPMLAPYDAGTYGEVWQIASGKQTVCQFWVYITVP